MRTSDNSIESADTEIGAKLAMRSNAGCEMRVVMVVPPSHVNKLASLQRNREGSSPCTTNRAAPQQTAPGASPI